MYRDGRSAKSKEFSKGLGLGVRARLKMAAVRMTKFIFNLRTGCTTCVCHKWWYMRLVVVYMPNMYSPMFV